MSTFQWLQARKNCFEVNKKKKKQLNKQNSNMKVQCMALSFIHIQMNIHICSGIVLEYMVCD